MSKRKLRRLGIRTFRYDAKLGKVVEITDRDKPDKRTPAVILFKEDWYEHIDENPIFIRSKRQLKEECEKRGLIAKALD